MTSTEVNIATVPDMVKNDNRIASSMIVESLNIPKTLVLQILKDDLGRRKLCACFVPHSLTPEQREDRVTSCQDMIAKTMKFSCFYNERRNVCVRCTAFPQHIGPVVDNSTIA